MEIVDVYGNPVKEGFYRSIANPDGLAYLFQSEGHWILQQSEAEVRDEKDISLLMSGTEPITNPRDLAQTLQKNADFITSKLDQQPPEQSQPKCRGIGIGESNPSRIEE